MTLSSENLWVDALFWKVEWVVDTDKEYKKFEKALSKKEDRESFVRAIDEWKWAQIVDLFWQETLTSKIDEAKFGKESWKGSMKPEVREAYLVLWQLMDWWASASGSSTESWTTWYQGLVEKAENNVKLEKALNSILWKIDNNKWWTETDKGIAKDAIKDLFKDCDSLEEFERRAWTRLATIEAIDNVEDIIKAVPNLVEKIWKGINKAVANFLEKCWIARDRVIAMFKDAIDAWKMAIQDFVDWCKEKWQNIVDISKIVLARWWEQFKKFLNYLEWVKEGVQEALNAAWEFCGQQWDKFVNMCGWIKDAIVDFWTKLIEQWKLAWKTFIESIKNNIDKATKICRDLLEKGKIAIWELVDWCKSMWQKWKELLASIIDASKSAWDQFANWCKENWQSAKDMFKSVAKSLLEKWKMTLDSFVNWCKWARETVKDTACNILVGLVNAGKFALNVIADALLVVVWSAVVLWELLLKAWKEIYGWIKRWWQALVKFISDVASVLWEKGKSAFRSLWEFAKTFMNKCKQLWLMAGNFIANVCKWVWEKMKSFWLSAAEFIKSTYETVKWALNNARDKTAEFFKNLWLAAKDIAVTLRESSKNAWKWCVNFVLKHVQNAFQFLKDTCKMTIDFIWKTIMSLKTHVVEFINYAKQLWIVTIEKIKEWCANSAEAIKNFVKTAIDKCKATWNDITNRFHWRLQDAKDILVSVFTTTKEWIKNFIKFTWKAVLEVGKFLLELWVWAVATVILALKELGSRIYDIGKLCVETLVKVGKLAADKLCQYLSEAFWATKDMIVTIGKYVAAAVNNCAKAVRDWIYSRIKDAKKAYEATKEWIKDSIADIAEWLYKRWVEIKQVCSIIKNSITSGLSAAREWLKWFASRVGMSISALWDIWTSA